MLASRKAGIYKLGVYNAHVRTPRRCGFPRERLTTKKCTYRNIYIYIIILCSCDYHKSIPTRNAGYDAAAAKGPVRDERGRCTQLEGWNSSIVAKQS